MLNKDNKDIEIRKFLFCGITTLVKVSFGVYRNKIGRRMPSKSLLPTKKLQYLLPICSSLRQDISQLTNS